jgi:hypothetical protein
MPRVTIETDLTQDEIAKLGRELARAETAKVKALVEKKVAMDGFKGRLDGLESRISELTTSIETGKSPIEMEVEERPGAPGVVEYYRPGTNEKVGERPMTFTDRQQGIAFPDPDDRDDDEPPAEEQEIADGPAEAEALRSKRLEDEHRERVQALIGEVAPLVKVTPLEGGGFLAALDISGESLRDTGDTEESARMHVLNIFADAQPKYVPLPDTVTWSDVAAASEEATSDVPTDAPPAPRTLSDAPKTLLKAPRRRRGGRVIDATGPEEKEVTTETLAAAEGSTEAGAPESGGEGAPAVTPECEPGCDIAPPHEHSAGWTAF